MARIKAGPHMRYRMFSKETIYSVFGRTPTEQLPDETTFWGTREVGGWSADTVIDGLVRAGWKIPAKHRVAVYRALLEARKGPTQNQWDAVWNSREVEQ